MRKNLPVTNKENDYDASKRIVSTTDLKGRITYANLDFLDISGFSEEEVIEKSHNIVRHPDMPPAAFQDLWDTIKTGKPWMGIVKNRCKNGDYYWVDAYVTPMIENKEVVGYQSVRIKPSAKDVHSAEKVYATLWNPQKGLISSLTSINLGLMGKMILSNTVAILAGMILFSLLSKSIDMNLIITCSLILFTNMFFAKKISKPWQETAAEAAGLYSNAVSQKVYTGRDDELGQIQLAMRMQKSKIETIIWRISDAASELKNSVDASLVTVSDTETHIDNQNREIEQVATAMNEMTATVCDIAKNTSNTADATHNAGAQANEGKEIVQSAIDHINKLSNEVENAVVKISMLAQDSKEIGNIVNVITEIAEQTNLLALNAAIEAARAGEQGRGFAVVADEVRTLASRTQEATHEISGMISKLQHSADTVAEVMKVGQTSASLSVEKAGDAGESLNQITSAVDTISQMTTQIAAAAEEQSAVSEEINRNIIRISDLSEHTLSGSKMICSSSNNIEQEVIRLNNLVSQFGDQI